MKTSVVGFPRIGRLRELKFACEKYFRSELPAAQLDQTARELRLAHWTMQRDAGIDMIPSNDFSFYDTTLDTAVLFGLVPQRYRVLGLSALDTYFAMARGYQGEAGDVHALPMKKWFNTNYHYNVPEIDDAAEIALVGTKPIDEYLEAKAAGIETKPAILGPFTLLNLANYTGSRQLADVVEPLASAYADLITRLSDAGAGWIQLDEPWLVRDLDKRDIALFRRLYAPILDARGNSRVLLQTYFGDIRDCYRDVCALAFDGIGLDFIEGVQTAELVANYGFPQDKVMFAGLVNGKNIWRNHYAHTIGTIAALRGGTRAPIVLSTSCSLLHVPYTLEHETQLNDSYRCHFAFAEEKLAELAELAELLDRDDPSSTPAAKANAALMGARPDSVDEAVRARVVAVPAGAQTRLPARPVREVIQKKELGLPLFPTTTIGSFPQTQEIRSMRARRRHGEISQQRYEEFLRDQIAEVVRRQDEVGLDVLVHGEFERNDMVEYFGERLDGFVFTRFAWVQSYGARCVKPPIIWGDVSRPKPMTVSWSSYAQSLTDKPMKGMLTGPVTILNWSFPREDIPVRDTTRQIALAIRDEVLDLEAAGIRVIQVDEAALREKLPLRRSDWQREYLDWAIPAFNLVHSGCRPETQIHTHMCYSEFADIIPAIDAMDADVISFEASRSELEILDSLAHNRFETEVGPGVYDIHSPRIPSEREIGEALARMLDKVAPDKLWVNPDCGLKTRSNAEVWPSLRNMVAAALKLRAQR